MSMFFVLAFFLIASHQHGFAQCDFSVSTGTSPCIFSFTSDVKGVDSYLIVHEWEFGDGCTSDVANPVHSYPSIPAGGPSQMYTVKHTVTATDPFTMLPIVGSPFICNQTVTVTPSTSCQLCPSLGEQGGGFNYHVTGCVVKFQSNLSGLFTHIWNFGDGSPIAIGITNPVHDYDATDPEDTDEMHYLFIKMYINHCNIA